MSDRRKEYEDLYELRDLIKETVKRAVDRIPEDRKGKGPRHGAARWMPPGSPAAPHELREMMARYTGDSDLLKDETEESPDKPERRFRAFYKLRRRILKRAEGAVVGFRAHAIPFFAVNAFLLFLWILLNFGGNPWFLYPLGAWGIGLLCHFTATRQLLRSKREVQLLPDLTEDETRVVRKMQGSRTGFAEHATAVAATSGFLIMIDVITGGSFPWSFIPTFAMATGLLTHWAAYSVRYRKRKRQVYGWMNGQDLADRPSSPALAERGGALESLSREAPEVREVERLKTQILKTLDKLRESGSTVGEDLYPILETYSSQIRDLCRKELEVGEVIDLIPTKDLDKERAALQEKLKNETSINLQREYEKSIAEIDRQLVSLDKLTKQREVLALRIRSAINSLRQIQIDLARMGSFSVADQAETDHLKTKFDELSRYLDDLSNGYAELD